MRASSLVGHVIEILDTVRSGRRPADAVVREFFRARHYLGASDRRYIAERTFEVLRHHLLLENYCRGALAGMGGAGTPKGIPSIMMVATFEARCAQPPGAQADMESAYGGLWRVFVPEIECAAFLKVVADVELPREVRDDPEKFLSVRHSIPRFLVAEWLRRFGPDETPLLCETLNRPAPVTIRVNTLRCTVEECRQALRREGIEAEPAPIAPHALTLGKRINAQGLSIFTQGWFEMQDEGSQLISFLTGAAPGMTIIDACAGSGGKSLHCAALMNNTGTLIAVDVDRPKLQRFEERCRRAGVTSARTVAAPPDADPVELRNVSADVVVVDAPCSGTGTLRRSPWLKLGLEEKGIEPLTRLQRSLLDRYATLVKPGGRLVYATCSLLEAENRGVVTAFLRDHPAFTLIPVREAVGRSFNVPGDLPPDALELLPQRSGTDGFFSVALMRKS